MLKKILAFFFLLILLLPNICVGGISDGLVAYYPFNGNANDESGNGNHGTVYGPTLTQDRFGNPNSAYYFDGSKGYISIPNNPMLNPTDQLTISFWIKEISDSTFPTNSFSPIIYKGVPSTVCSCFANREYSIWLWQPNRIYIASAGDGNCERTLESGQFSIGDWKNVTVVIDRKTNIMKIYIDGNLFSQTYDSYQSFNVNDSELRFGWMEEIYCYSPYYPFKGTLDEIRIYNRTLSESEIQELSYQETNLNQGLVAYYPFNGNANDESGNNNHASEIIGGVTFEPGIIGMAAKFGGYYNPGHIKIPNSSSLQFGSSLSINFWARVDELGSMDGYGGYNSSEGGGCIFAKDHDQSGLVGKAFVPSNSFITDLANNYFSSPKFEIGATYPFYKLGDWINVTFIVNNNELRTYYNGELANQVVGVPVDFTVANSRDLYFGQFSSYWYPYNGSLDEFRIYNRALSEAEIKELYNRNISYTISGIVTSNGTGLTNVQITLTDSINSPPKTATTLSDGTFSFSGLINGTYTITPNFAGYTFNPSSRIVNISGGNVSDQNFTLAPGALDHWTLRSSGNPNLWAVASGSETFIAVGDGQTIRKSVDNGVTWQGIIGGTSGTNFSEGGIAYGDGVFVAVATSFGRIFTSNNNGENWTLRYNGGSEEGLYEVAYGNGTFVAVGGLGIVFTSNNSGQTWTLKNEDYNTYTSVVYGKNGTFITVGVNGKILKSTDNGDTWSPKNSGTGYNLMGVAYGNSAFVAVGWGCGILVSTDNGETWQQRSPGYNLYGVTYGNGVFVAVGENGTILTSSDNGTTWQSRSSGTSLSLLGVTYGEGTFVAVGAGVIYQSDPLITMPSLLNPSPNSSINTSKITFQWLSVPNTTYYELLVDNNSGFGSPEIYIKNLTQTQYEVTNWFPNNTYYWKIIAYFADGSKSESAVGTFTYQLPEQTKPVWVPLYRLYKGGQDSDHFYTTNADQRDLAVNSMGYKYERIEGSISAVNAPGMVPLFQLYFNGGTKMDHFYTTSEVEKDNAIASSSRPYQYEGIAGFVYPNHVDGSVALYRLFLSSNVDHFYCTRATERDYAKATWGYTDEGVQGYLMPAESSIPLSTGRPSGYYGDTNTATGGFTYSHTDLSFPSPGPGIRFERFYNSVSTNKTTLGTGWTHNYDWYLYENETNSGEKFYFVHRGSGDINYYDKDFNPLYGGVYDTLSQIGNLFIITTPEKTKYTFESILGAEKNGYYLTRIEDRNNNPLTLTYDSGRLKTVTDSVGRQIVFTYDDSGNLAAISDPQISRVLQFQVNDMTNNLEWAADWKGNRTLFTYQKDLQGVESHRIQTITRPGNKLLATIEFDDEGRLTKQTDGLGNLTSYAYDPSGVATVTDPLSNTRNYTNDANYRLTNLTDSKARPELSGYNPDHELASFKNRRGYDAGYDYVPNTGNLSSNTYYIENGDTITTQLNYTDPNFPSFPTSSINPMTKTTNYTYYASGNLKNVIDPSQIPVSRDYYSNGQLMNRTDKNGRVTQYYYEDSWKNLTRVIDSSGGVTQYSYDPGGRRTSTTNALGYTTTYEYDQNDNLVKITDPLGNQTTNEYDENNTLIRTVNANGRETRFSYDLKDRMLSRTDSNGNSVSYTYDALGRKIGLMDENGKETSYQYDGDGNLIKITNPLSNISFEYDANGNLIRTIDGKGKSVDNQYDAVDQLTRVTNPLGFQTAYTYWKDGNISSRTDANGVATGYDYNDLGQLITISYPGSSISFEYYPNGNLKKMTDSGGETNYSYDDNNRVNSITDPFGMTVSYGYDLLGNRTSMTYPGNKTVRYEYDGSGRLVKVIDWLNGETGYTYDPAGNLIQTAYPNGTKALFSYDPNSRLIGVSNQKNTGTIISSYSYTRDKAGNILSIDFNESLPANNPSANISYSYDDANRLTTDNEYTYVYDNKGNLKNRTKAGLETNFSYNYENMLTGITGQTNLINTYNGFGHRLSKTLNGVQTRYVLDIASTLPNVVAETDGNGNVQAYYIYGLGLIGRIDASGTNRYYHFNQRGDTIALTDSQGNITDSYSYDEFGKVSAYQGDASQPFKFVGKYGVMDEGNGLSFMRARFYDLTNGRFFVEDPERYLSGINLFSYAENNPLQFIDPSGLKIDAIKGSSTSFNKKIEDLKKKLWNNPITVNLIDFLEINTAQIYIEEASEDKTGVVSSNTLNNKVSELKILFPNKGKVLGKQDYIAFAHELGHAELIINNKGGTLDQNPVCNETYTINKYEVPLMNESNSHIVNYFFNLQLPNNKTYKGSTSNNRTVPLPSWKDCGFK